MGRGCWLLKQGGGSIAALESVEPVARGLKGLYVSILHDSCMVIIRELICIMLE